MVVVVKGTFNIPKNPKAEAILAPADAKVLAQVRVPVGSRLKGVYLRELRLPRLR